MYGWLTRSIKSALARAGIDAHDVRVRLTSLRWRLRPRGAPAGWYDRVYASASDVYECDYRQSPYLPLWMEIAERLDPGDRVLEIGCGTGQLAELLITERSVDYTGFDFSGAAVAVAKRRLPEADITVDDALTTALVERPVDAVVCTEVLEHVREDRLILKRLGAGVRVVATVPDFPAETHLRWFKSADEVHTRYADLFSQISVTAHKLPTLSGTFFVLDGRR